MMAKCEGCGREVEAHTLKNLMTFEIEEGTPPTEIRSRALCGLCAHEVVEEHAREQKHRRVHCRGCLSD
jgi:hypothetical protein